MSGGAASGLSDDGGGIANYRGALTLTDSTVSGNSTRFDGGGVYNRSGNAALTHSTVSGNNAFRGGGIFSNTNLSTQTTTLSNSTVSGNSASSRGGGVFNIDGLTVIEHSTLTGNISANLGGGVASVGDSRTLTRCGPPSSPPTPGTDVDFVFGAMNSFDSDGDNLIGDGNATGVFNQGGDQTGVADPGLGPLADNGGPTQTHAPLAGSPAIDAVTGTCPRPNDDQRGEPRPQGPACDIGSVEVMAAPSPDLAVSKTDSPDPVVVTDHLTYTITVNNAGEGDATGVTLSDTLPSSVNFVSVAPGGCGETGGVVECDLGDLASGDDATVTIVVQPTTTGVIQQRRGHQRRDR